MQRRNTHTLFTKAKLFALAFVAIGVLAGLYIYQVNLVTNLAYHVAQEERTIAELTSHTRTLTASHAEASSFQKFSELALQLEFEKISQVSYVRIPSSTVAKNQ